MPNEPQSYTVRLALFDIQTYTPRELADIYKDKLKAAGFTTTQYPTVNYPDTSFKVKNNDPYKGARTIRFSVAGFGDFEQTADLGVTNEEDPSILARSGKVFSTVFSWNLCTDVQTGAVGNLRDIFRRTFPNPGSMKTSPKVTTFAEAPETLDGYPAKASKPCIAESAPGKKSTKPLWFAAGAWILWALSKGKL